MPATSFTCPKCRSTLKSANPVPAGRKIKCPKCATVFATTGEKPQTSNTAIQEKARVPAPAPAVRDEEPGLKDELEDGGWELVDDEPAGAKAQIESIPFAKDDLPTAAVDEEDEEAARPKRKTAKAQAKAKTNGKAKTRREEDEEEDEEEDDEPRPRRKAVVRDDYDDEDEEDDDDDLDDDLDEDEEERPRRKKQAFKKKTGGTGKVLLVYGLILGSLLLLLVAGGGVALVLYLNAGKNKGTGDEDPLAFLPPQTVDVVGLDMRALVGQQGIGTVMENFVKNKASSEFFTKVTEQTGIEFADLCDHTYVASTTFGGGLGQEVVILILHSKVPFSQRKVRNALKEPKPEKLKGKTVYKVNVGEMRTLFMPSDRIIVLTNAPADQLEAIVGSDGKTPVLPPESQTLLRNLEQQPCWWLLPISENTRKEIKKGADTAPLEDLKALMTDLARCRGVGMALSFAGNSTHLKVEFICADAAAAKKMAGDLTGIWNRQVKSFIVQAALTSDKAPKAFSASYKEMIKTTEFSNAGSSAKASMQLGTQNLVGVIQEFQKQQSQMMRLVRPPEGAIVIQGGPVGRR